MKTTNLRVCGRCEWIFKATCNYACPKCDFATYGARFAYGNKCYNYAKTQKPWYDQKMSTYSAKLKKEIGRTEDEAVKEGKLILV